MFQIDYRVLAQFFLCICETEVNVTHMLFEGGELFTFSPLQHYYMCIHRFAVSKAVSSRIPTRSYLLCFAEKQDKVSYYDTWLHIVMYWVRNVIGESLSYHILVMILYKDLLWMHYASVKVRLQNPRFLDCFKGNGHALCETKMVRHIEWILQSASSNVQIEVEFQETFFYTWFFFPPIFLLRIEQHWILQAC